MRLVVLISSAFLIVSIFLQAQTLSHQSANATADSSTNVARLLELDRLVRSLNVSVVRLGEEVADLKRQASDLRNNLTVLLARLSDVDKSLHRLNVTLANESARLRSRVEGVSNSVASLEKRVHEVSAQLLSIYVLLAASLGLNVVALYLLVKRRRSESGEIC